MSLIDSMSTACTMLDRTTQSDSVFGMVTTYRDGAKFRAAIGKDSSMEARLAEKQGVTEVYSVIVKRGFPLQYHDVFRRDSDGAIFRVTSNITDSEAPDVSTVQIGKVTAERWVLPA